MGPEVSDLRLRLQVDLKSVFQAAKELASLIRFWWHGTQLEDVGVEQWLLPFTLVMPTEGERAWLHMRKGDALQGHQQNKGQRL